MDRKNNLFNRNKEFTKNVSLLGINILSMIQSMTGYGKSVLLLPTKKVTVEVKSLNSKNLDLHVSALMLPRKRTIR